MSCVAGKFGRRCTVGGDIPSVAASILPALRNHTVTLPLQMLCGWVMYRFVDQTERG